MREMKDSGVEWIGEIPAEWELTKIGSVYQERNVKVSDKEYTPLSVTKQGILPQLETAAKTDNGDNRKLIKKGDFVINSRSDRRGSCGISGYDGSCSLINIVLQPRKNICNSYYGFVFRSECFANEFYRWGNGIVDDLWSTKWSSMKRIYIPAPSLEEQCCIADYLKKKCTEIDYIIAKQQKIIEKLKAYKQSVITETVTKGLNPDVKMKDSGIEWIGLLPADWGIVKLGNIFSILGGYPFDSDGYVDESYNQVIRIGNVKNNVLLLENNPVFINDITAEKASEFKVCQGTILFTMTGTKGKRDYFFTYHVKDYDIDGKNLYLNQRVGCLIPVNDICASYYNYLLKDTHILDSIFLYETGTANQGNLGIESIRRTKLQFPSKVEQITIADFLDKKCSAIDSNIRKKQVIIDKLATYKKLLIYEVVTGKKEI